MSKDTKADPNHTLEQYGFSNGSPTKGSVGPYKVGKRDPNWTREELNIRDLSAKTPRTL